jgi:hypothetical protein
MYSLTCACSSGELIRNPRITRWCDEHPCEWTASGTVRRVGTWHPDDYAVALVSDDAKLTQTNGTVDQKVSDCFAFSLISKISRGTDVYLELDFLSDGQVEISQRLPASNWDQSTFKLTAPRWYRGVTFTLRKQGSGEAIIAQLSAENAKGACTAPPVELRNRPDGAPCEHDEQCANDSCSDHACGGCAAGEECAADQVCGLTTLSGKAEHVCLARFAGLFGEPCDTGDQCESQICENHACSECTGDKCEDGRACDWAAQRSDMGVIWPKLCGALDGSRKTGELCGDDRDCASATCEGLEESCPFDCGDFRMGDDSALDECLQWCRDGQIRGGRCR